MEVGGQVRDLTIVGSYQDITNGGKTAKSVLPTQGNDVMWYVVGVALAPGTDAAATAQAYGDQLAPAKVHDIEQWRAQTLRPIARQMTVTAAISAVVAVALVGLMTALFTRMILARDAGPIAVQRALGADDGGLRAQYVTRTVLVLALGVVVGAVAAATLGEAMFNLMFEGLYGGMEALGRGTSRIDFAVDPLLTYVLLPAALLGSVSLVTAASARSLSDARISALTTD
ncbi:hypothetical protein N866_02370 [Actinotalea ferrariae CF5-4]|uniref:ABC3 transporter permease C-terminal domain-containing protein n=1 Tax=Actinotalea ferrariae CF5-4 TaxID=948458 RepID=A0A021VPW5_9CELL|nr:FtsX-like permease family protein [Actinotalea ferrariae]EYR63191.1 hypothetical protein N866_02370 [Actinotalea ferrariae CF5-4]